MKVGGCRVRNPVKISEDEMEKRDENLRIGQELFLFLRWLRATDRVTCNGDYFLADPFNISDEQWIKWLGEFRAITKKAKP